eukprot:gnl/TRDRNA2_/TRDRNA2_168052_c0_seq1.p1 gnl/TRDRNA2_/TRDRNA2_168052_c0~~gnl/TRDRNA2_/TRDRNA2_168052_c0_seq1.p1  ORF type:complete len:895 (-),score=154.02 gnl/TRDRNA2_/TRDRNA2_168052_c0_seq1:198-2849(-)
MQAADMEVYTTLQSSSGFAGMRSPRATTAYEMAFTAAYSGSLVADRRAYNEHLRRNPSSLPAHRKPGTSTCEKGMWPRSPQHSQSRWKAAGRPREKGLLPHSPQKPQSQSKTSGRPVPPPGHPYVPPSGKSDSMMHTNRTFCSLSPEISPRSTSRDAGSAWRASFHHLDLPDVDQAIWRGPRISKTIAMQREDNQEFARYRRDMRDEASREQRLRVRQIQMRREEQLRRKAMEQEHSSDESAEESSSSSKEEPQVIHSRRVSNEVLDSEGGIAKDGVKNRKSMNRGLLERKESLGNAKQTAEEPSSTHRHVHLHDPHHHQHRNAVSDKHVNSLGAHRHTVHHGGGKSWKKNMLKGLDRCRKRKMKLMKRQTIRQKMFLGMRDEDQDVLTKAFKGGRQAERAALQEGGVHRHVHCLQHHGLQVALKEMGLAPVTDVEKREVTVICDEILCKGDVDLWVFCCEVAPRVREILKEVRHGPLLQHFKMTDIDDSGSLSEAECWNMIERLFFWNMDAIGLKMLQSAFTDTIGRVKCPASGEVQFEGFESLIANVQEHYQRILQDRERAIKAQRELTQEDTEEHWDEIVHLHDAFMRANYEGHGHVTEDELRMLLIEFGLFPRDEEGLEKVAAKFQEVANEDGELSFKNFLKVVRHVRDVHKHNAQAKLKKLFDIFDFDHSGQLSMGEVSRLIADLGLTPRCRDDQREMKRLLEQIDADGSGEVSFSEFQFLVQHISTRINAAQRRREAAVAAECGYSDSELCELRDAFHTLDKDGEGVLHVAELRAALDLMRREMSCEELRKMILSHQTTHPADELREDMEIGLEFEGFLRFIKTIQPHLVSTRMDMPKKKEISFEAKEHGRSTDANSDLKKKRRTILEPLRTRHFDD